ncbi:putative flavonoid 3'-monooxygenase [Rosa chinensis]|uniref:Putative flavonoid 3'-monooxygenase n=1 Tax=Rosa chinensis TaxID=74649 RepID=A0A2P6QX99_ROSCH|nr:putative flavonoid 3'-monooxygenase [Rosa chinensis]
MERKAKWWILVIKIGVLIEDIMYRMIVGRKKNDWFDMNEIIKEAISLFRAFNIADYVPFLSPFDFQSLKKDSKRIDQLLEKIIEEHEANTRRGKHGQYEDFVDVLLSFTNQRLNMNDERLFPLDRTNVKAILFDMLMASFDTSAVAIVWTIGPLPSS